MYKEMRLKRSTTFIGNDIQDGVAVEHNYSITSYENIPIHQIDKSDEDQVNKKFQIVRSIKNFREKEERMLIIIYHSRIKFFLVSKVFFYNKFFCCCGSTLGKFFIFLIFLIKVSCFLLFFLFQEVLPFSQEVLLFSQENYKILFTFIYIVCVFLILLCLNKIFIQYF